jgi:site-specific DNA-adenine methylase
LDPPYYNGESGFYRFTVKDHEDLHAVLSKIQGKWVLMYDEDDHILKLYEGFHIRKIASSLSSQKVENGGKRIRLRQLLITNFPLQTPS